jgi:hypothetical protein
VLINILVLTPSRERMQARHKYYNESNGGVNWERNARSAGWGQIDSRERKMGLDFKVGMFVKTFSLFVSWDDLLGLRSLSC